MGVEAELKEILIGLAECTIDSETWKDWWTAHSAEVKQIVSPGDFSRLNCAPGMYGANSYMEKCQAGAERYLKKLQVPFRHSTKYSSAADKERQQYHERMDQERAKQQKEIEEKMERDRRDPEGLPFYKKLIDLFVDEARKPSLAEMQVREKGFPQCESCQKLNDLLDSLSSEQRQLIGLLLQNERETAISGILCRLDWLITCDGLELHQHGYKMPYMTFDDMHHDFIRRMEGDEWPDEEG